MPKKKKIAETRKRFYLVTSDQIERLRIRRTDPELIREITSNDVTYLW